MSGSRRLNDEDWAALHFEATTLFTPSAPIGVAELFAGRQQQIRTLLDTVGEPGRHAIVYGEPGVGKTSVSQIIRFIIPSRVRIVKFYREAAFSNDTFSSLWLRIFRHMSFVSRNDDAETLYNLADLYAKGVTQGDVVREMRDCFSENDIPIIVIDEYNVVKDESVPAEMAETIKALSDDGVNITIIVVGVSDSVAELVRGHSSLIRCSEEVLMPRMATPELRELLEKRIGKLGMKIDGNAKWKTINLSKGLPAFTHSLGKGAALSAIKDRRLTIRESDVDGSINILLKSSQNTLKNDYEIATRSNQERARYKQIITACALAKSDESGYFIPKQVQQPLADVLKKPVGIDGFNRNLRELTEDKRGRVLQAKGTERLYRYRFRNPAMQPFVIMQGIQEGFLDDKARLALSSPEQPDLFSSET